MMFLFQKDVFLIVLILHIFRLLSKTKSAAIFSFSISPLDGTHAHALVLRREQLILTLSLLIVNNRRNLQVRSSSFNASVCPSVRHTDIFSRHFTSSRRIFASFLIIRETFRFIYRSFFSLPRPHCMILF